jgi:predicted TIM-barrel fold metal-dependent hydrolase
VQRVAPDDPRLDAAYEEASRAGVPVVLHAGREPSSASYGVDTRALCSADAVDRILARHEGLTLVVPHLGADEFFEYERLLDKHARLYLDTTMVLAGYFRFRPDPGLLARRATRLLYGTDFPNVPYAWDRELKALLAQELGDDTRHLLGGTARRLFLPGTDHVET